MSQWLNSIFQDFGYLVEWLDPLRFRFFINLWICPSVACLLAGHLKTWVCHNNFFPPKIKSSKPKLNTQHKNQIKKTCRIASLSVFASKCCFTLSCSFSPGERGNIFQFSERSSDIVNMCITYGLTERDYSVVECWLYTQEDLRLNPLIEAFYCMYELLTSWS